MPIGGTLKNFFFLGDLLSKQGIEWCISLTTSLNNIVAPFSIPYDLFRILPSSFLDHLISHTIACTSLPFIDSLFDCHFLQISCKAGHWIWTPLLNDGEFDQIKRLKHAEVFPIHDEVYE